MINTDKLIKVMNNHRGKENAATTSQIAKELGIKENYTNTHIRKATLEALEKGCCICSCDKGYFVANTYTELTEYINSLYSRIFGIQKRMSLCINLMNTVQNI